MGATSRAERGARAPGRRTGDFSAALKEEAIAELHDVRLVHGRHHLALVIDRVLRKEDAPSEQGCAGAREPDDLAENGRGSSP